ncbi:SDR family NAD(P)-dependent oxidoreductase [Secundilactobacillus silagei]|uniref:Short-chain dehydrogenase n=1 Tax=Secundilactobacillus silagei JCM 19001 TaxID=1302250 RepID=A0A1Z5IG56_9LACO|nr:SDR family NAD(P)-dependent oxidoreductase [Secundilactobacillus silagei]TDG73295.1 hypothetical protein C5L25_000444 [Secundilactobacillus silagei JCM 19001]GAX00666.1 short-chain dehydrogenase [Secundilactobacillus silagei JCM 19001]
MTKTWFITGSSRGLGHAIATRALQAGDQVVATARHTDALKDLVAQYGDQLFPLALDVTDADAVAKTVKTATDHFGNIDVLVNNAGFANMAALEDVPLDDFKRQMDTDFYGTLYTIKAILPSMRKRQNGHIINISSIGGRAGSAGLAAYQSAKFAVNGLTEVVAQEVAPFNVKVTTVEPGGMRTDWGGKSMEADVDSVYQDTVGAMISMVHDGWDDPESDNRYVSEPAKVADAIYTLSNMTEAPVHLLIGKDAEQGAEMHEKMLHDSDAKFKELTESTGNDQ